ncbi:protein-serine O-palmitoleoyltransferase por [Nomia melanderi]|uniref:protein-serine O-palmitoleoyltransferase por n=1 Tax=Nomia melanderi TaxID=2448451 RepID=UPI0013046F70|nr:protein-serine O-palmitoleoyltransferase porcupine [Nomia melanderi]XP_031846799.1 protein-serine O-palmitoleoyltransferase porcupine [Nomia melanderi]XP_031846800.1 protein-serine O-palmitoleoyltransferase porcupine [Nomia melanderi]
MDDIEAPIFYDDEGDFVGHKYFQDSDYEYEYEENTERGTLLELYQYCLNPTVYDTALYILPLLISMILFRLCARSQFVSHKIFHTLSVLIGIYNIHHYVTECLYTLLILCIFSYITLHLPKKYCKSLGIFLPSLLIIVYCEFSMSPLVWHKIRSVVMIMAMKTISVAVDKVDSNDLPDIYSYMGYTFCGVTCVFGPWISFKDYISVRYINNQDKWWILYAAQFMVLSFLFLTMSNCWTQWIIMDNSWKWLLAYRDALSFRTSHYFISYIASTALLIGGFPCALTTLVKPLKVEFPRSLVQVVICWNIPMHFWLKTYIFRPSIKYLGKFGAVTMTYLISALLHGLNFQLAAVLLSLGFYTYVEFQLRSMLANIFDACIASKQCTKGKCTHTCNTQNSWWVLLTNMMFSGLSVFHLAYLGLMFDTSELQETGYSYIHTIEKWSQLGFASHWVMFATYLIYFLIR